MRVKIDDFGEKIGGARKDMWMSHGGLTKDDLLYMNEAECDKYVTKENIWPRPDYKKLKETGVSEERLMYIKGIYDAVPKSNANHELFIDFVSSLKKFSYEILSENEEDFEEDINSKRSYSKYLSANNLINETGFSWNRFNRNSDFIKKGLFTNKMIKVMTTGYDSLVHKVNSSKFLIDDEKWFLRTHKIMFIDGEKVKIREDRERKCLELYDFEGYVRTYRYPEDAEELKENKYVIVSTERYVGENCFPCDNFEECYSKLRDEARKYKEKCIDSHNNSTIRKIRKVAWKRDIVTDGCYRNGPEILNGADVNGNDYLATFGFKGGEFGNWLNQSDRQNTLNNGYEAFADLASALGIDGPSVSLNGTLSIAFGSRGSGSAAAHYEPLRKVINLTKTKGAGCLAHEFGHALDDYICANGLSDKRQELVEKMKYKKVEDNGFTKFEKTDYFKDSEEFDTKYSKCDKGYWASAEEMFARAFDCYITDKLDYKSEYLCGITYLGQPAPKGEEKKEIFEKFDELINDCKTKGILEEGMPDLKKFEPKREENTEKFYCESIQLDI